MNEQMGSTSICAIYIVLLFWIAYWEDHKHTLEMRRPEFKSCLNRIYISGKLLHFLSLEFLICEMTVTTTSTAY